jgi:hypothetical protein
MHYTTPLCKFCETTYASFWFMGPSMCVAPYGLDSFELSAYVRCGKEKIEHNKCFNFYTFFQKISTHYTPVMFW